MRQRVLLIVGAWLLWLLSLQPPLFAQEGDGPPPWDEPALVKMAELGLDGPTVVRQLKKRSWKFEVDEGLLSRLKKAGLPDEALEFLRKSARPQGEGVAENLMVWAARDSEYHEASLHSELWIIRENGIHTPLKQAAHILRRIDRPYMDTPLQPMHPLDLLRSHILQIGMQGVISAKCKAKGAGPRAKQAIESQ